MLESLELLRIVTVLLSAGAPRGWVTDRPAFGRGSDMRTWRALGASHSHKPHQRTSQARPRDTNAPQTPSRDIAKSDASSSSRDVNALTCLDKHRYPPNS